MSETLGPQMSPLGAPQDLCSEFVALAQSGAAISVASCDDAGRPIVGLGVGCRVEAGGRLRIILGRAANERFLCAVDAGRAVAVTFTGTRDHGAFQIKAAHARRSISCLEDRPEIARQCMLLRDGLVEIGFSAEQAAGYAAYDPDDLTAIEIMPERVFSQTPGPGAGSEVRS